MALSLQCMCCVYCVGGSECGTSAHGILAVSESVDLYAGFQ